MSVDKFGRHETSVLTQRLRGPPGVGFKTTVEGDYDVSSKRLRMVGQPKDENDAVTLSYVKDNCLQLIDASRNNKYYDASRQVIRNLKEPVENTDAVNKSYIDSRTPQLVKEGWNFDKKRLINVSQPISSNDAVNKEYVEQRMPTRGQDNWNFSNMRLSNVAEPVSDNDSVNVSFLKLHVMEPVTTIKETTLSLDTTKDLYDAKGKCITNVRDAVSENDAVNLHILNAFREATDNKISDIWDKFEDEMSSLAYLLAHRLNDALIRWAPETKQKPWRNNFEKYSNI